jgi:putative ABC transport system permease protein
MIKNYLKIAFRNLMRNKVYSFINIGGLTVGMTVAMLIGFWIYDELNFDKSFDNYKRIGQLYQNRTFDGKVGTFSILPQPMVAELKAKYPDFKSVALVSYNNDFIIELGEKKIIQTGLYAEAGFTKMFSLEMLKGSQDGLEDVNAIMLSEKTAQMLFENENPINKTLKINNKGTVKIIGIFKNFPFNSTFREVNVLCSWGYARANDADIRANENNWSSNGNQCFVQLADNVDFEQASQKIKKIIYDHETDGGKDSKPESFILPMSKWYLESDFRDGVNVGGRLQLVLMFGAIGVFVLLLACINFMNLSTARSEKRAKEVGIRKAIGSVRSQLITQFFSESFVVVGVSFFIALVVVSLVLPFFNDLANKQIIIPAANPVFWVVGLAYCLFTGIISGSYPALYLSSFQPIKVLKGTFSAGRWAATPRKVLVVVQFTVSVALVVGTTIVYQQIQYAKNRSVGYKQDRLIFINKVTPELMTLNPTTLRNELLATNVVENVAESSEAITTTGSINIGFSWEGSDPKASPIFNDCSISSDFAHTVGFEFIEGRNFSADFASDSNAVILNETAAKLIGMKGIIDKKIHYGVDYHVIGVIKDVINSNPYQQVFPAIYFLGKSSYFNNTIIKLKENIATVDALKKVEAIYKKFNPSSPFDYKFVDAQYAQIFEMEERIGKLASIFAVLAIFISCLGLFGLSSFVVEQRTKEIGVRKVLGASVGNLCGLLAKDFVVLVLIASFLAIPISYYFLDSWLQSYEYHTNISWWVFALAGVGALAITLLTVSWQSIRAALANPVKSLRSE